MTGKVKQYEMEPEILHLRCCRPSESSLGLGWGIFSRETLYFATALVYEDRAKIWRPVT